MAESIFIRVRRIMSGRLEDVIDRMERAGSDSLMREAIREVDRAIDEVKREADGAASRRLLAARQQRTLREKARELTGKANFAIGEMREDLAEAALSRQVDFEAQADRLGVAEKEADAEEAELRETLAALQARKQDMQDALATFLTTRREATPCDGAPAAAPRNVAQRVARAEQAFERAMGADSGIKRTDTQTIQRVAELDQLQKRALVAERLAALKQGAPTP